MSQPRRVKLSAVGEARWFITHPDHAAQLWSREERDCQIAAGYGDRDNLEYDLFPNMKDNDLAQFFDFALVSALATHCVGVYAILMRVDHLNASFCPIDGARAEPLPGAGG